MISFLCGLATELQLSIINCKSVARLLRKRIYMLFIILYVILKMKNNSHQSSTTIFFTNTATCFGYILLSRLTPYAEEITEVYQGGFWSNRSTTDHIFCIRQILEKKWEYNEVVHQLFIDFKKAYDSVRREVLHNILIELVSPWNW
jgi:hypothetical protein